MKYVPQPAAVEYLKDLLLSDERLDPFSPTIPGPLAATYAASSLAVLLEGFPVNYRNDYSYTDAEIRKCRRWIRAQTEWTFRQR